MMLALNFVQTIPRCRQKCFICILDKPFGCKGNGGLCPRDRLGRFHRRDCDFRAIFNDTNNITFCVMDWIISGVNINCLTRTIDPFERVRLKFPLSQFGPKIFVLF